MLYSLVEKITQAYCVTAISAVRKWQNRIREYWKRKDCSLTDVWQDIWQQWVLMSPKKTKLKNQNLLRGVGEADNEDHSWIYSYTIRFECQNKEDSIPTVTGKYEENHQNQNGKS